MKLKRQETFYEQMDEAWLKEAAGIEAGIVNVSLTENEADKEWVRSKIMMQICQPEEKVKRPAYRRRHLVRWAAVFAAILVGIFGLSMTSQAIVEMWRRFLAERQK